MKLKTLYRLVGEAERTRNAANDAQRVYDARLLDLVRRLAETLALCDLTEEGANGLDEKQSAAALRAEEDAAEILREHALWP